VSAVKGPALNCKLLFTNSEEVSGSAFIPNPSSFLLFTKAPLSVKVLVSYLDTSLALFKVLPTFISLLFARAPAIFFF
jgi:hypothetical protein